MGKSAYARCVLLLAGFASLLALTAACYPGPWHEDVAGADERCQCPFCKIAGQGVLESTPSISLAPPTLSSLPVLSEEERAEQETLLRHYFARAPPA